MAYGTEYAMRYYRDEFWAKRFQQAGIRNKPAGWHLSPHRYQDRADCVRDIAHINNKGPTHPVELVVLYNGIERS